MTGIFFKKDILGRMGGDEFAVFITNASGLLHIFLNLPFLPAADRTL